MTAADYESTPPDGPINPGFRDVAAYDRNAAFVPDMGAPLIALLDPTCDQHILDIGCGDGELSARLARYGCSVTGIDVSPEMVEAARARGIKAHLMAAESLTFQNEFDAALSNAALHWTRDLDAVLVGIYRALKPGARFVAEMGGEGNVSEIETGLTSVLDEWGRLDALRRPWRFESVESITERLRQAGFTVEMAMSFPRPTPLPTDMRGWLTTFAGAFIEAAGPGQDDAFLDAVIDRLAPRLSDSHGNWIADYVRLRISAVKPETSR